MDKPKPTINKKQIQDQPLGGSHGASRGDMPAVPLRAFHAYILLLTGRIQQESVELMGAPGAYSVFIINSIKVENTYAVGCQ
jgi:hypothetical protein